MPRSTIATWNRNPADEEAMGATHAPIWRRMADVSVPHDISTSTVLDYGCNQGGFLRLLYDSHSFKHAVGIDIARESVARAELLKGHRPIEYKVADTAASLGRTFDYAFSHEVIYLLPDLAAHARTGGSNPLAGRSGRSKPAVFTRSGRAQIWNLAQPRRTMGE